MEKTDNILLDKYHLLIDSIKKYGEQLSKKHGSWYKVHTFDNNYLIYDTWNRTIYCYPNGAIPSDINNMYRVVYVFYDDNGRIDNYYKIEANMADFWRGHIN